LNFLRKQKTADSYGKNRPLTLFKREVDKHIIAVTNN